MLFGNDGLANFFLFMFLFGLIFTVASLLLGLAHAGDIHVPHAGGGHSIDVGHVGHAAHGAHGGHVGHDSHGGVDDGPSILNMPTIMAFITWFGGVGYLLRESLHMGALFAVPIALASGVVGGAIMFVLLARVLWPMVTPPMENKDYSLPGTPARVVSSIRPGGVGEIVYMKGGTRFTAGAKGVDDRPIPKGAEVVILNYERGLAQVQGVDDMLASGN